VGGETAYVGLGSNLGDREAHLLRALAGLRASPGLELVAVSPLYETDPVGPTPQGPYLNAAAELRVDVGPRELLERLLSVEAQAGRVRGSARDAPRTLDLDLLLFGDRVVDEPGLEIPHPRLHERGFALEPLADLAPQTLHPVCGRRIDELARRRRDPRAVRRQAAPPAGWGPLRERENNRFIE
jgi:2-amino-4-hydroxy-6-hydroxymethyldihydropteridine diphosphokinase